eukprot:4577538-Prymnesium_polylepis.1
MEPDTGAAARALVVQEDAMVDAVDARVRLGRLALCTLGEVDGRVRRPRRRVGVEVVENLLRRLDVGAPVEALVERHRDLLEVRVHQVFAVADLGDGVIDDTHPADLADARQRRHEGGARVVAGTVRLQRRLRDIGPMRLDNLQVGPQARERVVPVLLRVVARDPHVQHIVVARRRPLLLVVDNAVAPRRVGLQRLQSAWRDRRGESFAQQVLRVELDRVLDAREILVEHVEARL